MTLTAVPAPPAGPGPGTVPDRPSPGRAPAAAPRQPAASRNRPRPAAVPSAGPADGTVPVPVAFLGRTSTLQLQDPVASLRRQLRTVTGRLPAGWYIAAHYWDIESGGLDLEDRGHKTGYDQLNVGIPRDGGLAALLAETASPVPRFAAVMCEDIARSGRDTYNSIKLEKELAASGVPLLAADEPIDTSAMTATTLLLRRMKQAMAEWYRFEVKEKAAAGFTEHTMAGYNVGTVPYGYLADRIPHPVPSKAAQGRTKTRLVLNPDTAPVVEQIFTWRTKAGLGMTTIAARLNASKALFPPPGKSGCWQLAAVANILRNPKYTGYMVYGRTATRNGRRGHRTTPDQWLWSPEPTHPPIITRPVWDAAQAAGAEHATSADTPGLSRHPQARTVYPLRGIIACELCGKRMAGRTYPRLGLTYYRCPHRPNLPHHAAACPGHPATVQVRQDDLAALLGEFFDTRIFGPDRLTLLAATHPGGIPQPDHHREKETAKLDKRLREIDAAENAYTREIEQLATTGAGSPAITALRGRILARFTELETERTAITARLTAIAAAASAAPDPGLLDQLPRLTGLLDQAPAELQQDLCKTFRVQITYHHTSQHVTITATISTGTADDLATVIGSQPPATTGPMGQLLNAPIAALLSQSHV